MASDATPHYRPHRATATRRELALTRLGPVPFTRAAALSAGLTLNDLRSPAVKSLLRGIYAPAHLELTHAVRCSAAALILPPGGRIAAMSAAGLLELPVPLHDLMTISLPHGSSLRHRGFRVLHHEPKVGDTLRLPDKAAGEMWISSPSVALCESASLLPLVDSVVLADAATHRFPQSAHRWLDSWRTDANPRVRQIADLADPGAESPMETRTRLLVTMAGAPTPVSQFEVKLSKRWRFDLAWPEYRVACEYDGSYHDATEAQRNSDLLRAEELRAAGWHLIPVVSTGIFSEPHVTVQRVLDALTERGCRIRPSDEWRVHFRATPRDRAG